jgi:intracellular sulfur oxidation DsrE/DsrF family protein
MNSPSIPRARRSFSVWAAAALAAASLSLPLAALAQATPTASKTKAVFQVSDADPQKWNLALNNVRNAAEDLGDEAVVLEVVVYGPGIGMLKSDSPVAARVAAALKSGVKVVACENTMKGQKLVAADMLPGIGYVPAGVVELIKKQGEGYAYIRP